MNINLRHIRALHAIWVHGTFARAAQDMGVVPSALTETIRHFEAEAGGPLFDRSQRPPAPTALALTFLQETAPLIEGLDRAMLRLQVGGDAAAGVLTIGCTPSAISDPVAPVLARLRKAHPGLRLRVHDDIAEHLARGVVEGALDLAVAGRALHSDDLRQTEILRDPFGLACPAGHPLARQQSAGLHDIDPDEVIVLDPGTGTQQLLATCPAVPAALRNGAIEAHSTISQLCMIRAGLGVALLPRNALMLFGDPALRFVPLHDLDLWRVLYLLAPTRRKLSAPARTFVEALKAVGGPERGT
ncbi:LysR family transcriptional regulator [Gemmobacter sp.]|uniref:LysR family transcriptional regulator n=1 Tax=Gemmobacter sp. TaxID=1898957 RepID=UPI002AFE9729|nr:LysR family transcriptional regulator [Gemmobacter sp.]